MGKVGRRLFFRPGILRSWPGSWWIVAGMVTNQGDGDQISWALQNFGEEYGVYGVILYEVGLSVQI